MHLNLEDIYDYSKFSNNSNFCRCVTVKQLVTKNKKTIDHKAIIFFSDFDIKRFINSEHILLDGTFIYPIGFMQTIIFMYYDNISDKMIPGIFIIINNKTYEGYVDCFIYIKNYIYKLNNNEEKINIKTFTTDFEIALYHAFNIVFNKNKNIRHIGCFFHYMQNIRKFLQKNNLTTLKTKPIYNVVINFCKKLPFENLDINNIKKKMLENFKIYNKELENFILYFNENWLNYFKDGTLNLKYIDIKFRTNNCLENFNRILKSQFNTKKNIPLVTFIDMLKNLVLSQIELLINQSKIGLKPLSKSKIKGFYEYKFDNISIPNFDDICNEIVSFYTEPLYFTTNKNLVITEKLENNLEITNNIQVKKNDQFENNFNYEDIKLDIPIDKNNKDNKMISVYDNNIIGLKNLGNTCYINSGLQIILHLKIFVNNLYKESRLLKNQVSNSLIQIIDNISNYIDNGIKEDDDISISPYEFKNIFAKNHPLFNNNEQQDCVEFLRILFEDLSKENNRISENYSYKELDTHNKDKKTIITDFHKLFLEKENSFVIENFYIQILNTYICQCGYENYSCEKMLDFPLNMLKVKNYNLIELINLNMFYDDIKWILPCKKCQKKNLIITQKIKFNIINDILFISLQRFDRITNSINESMIAIDEMLDLKQFMDPIYDIKNYIYLLKGIINYKGNLVKGHYWSYIKIYNNWFEFNDSNIKKIEKIDLISDTACILVYERQ